MADDLRALIAEMPADADFRVVLGYVGKLLLDAQTDPGRAWRDYRLELEGLQGRAAALSPKLDEIALALAEGRFQEVLTLSDRAMGEFAAAGLTPEIGRMHVMRALAYVQMQAGDLQKNGLPPVL